MIRYMMQIIWYPFGIALQMLLVSHLTPIFWLHIETLFPPHNISDIGNFPLLCTFLTPLHLSVVFQPLHYCTEVIFHVNPS